MRFSSVTRSTRLSLQLAGRRESTQRPRLTGRGTLRCSAHHPKPSLDIGLLARLISWHPLEGRDKTAGSPLLEVAGSRGYVASRGIVCRDVPQ